MPGPPVRPDGGDHPGPGVIGLRGVAFFASAAIGGGAGASLVGDAGPHVGRQHRPAAVSGTGCSTPVGRQVCGRTGDPRVRSAMLLGALLEGGNLTGPWPVGDNGAAYGPYQLHGAGQAAGEDPARATAIMLPRYAEACSTVPAPSWRADPRGSAAQCAYRAEKPARMYTSPRVRDAWARLGGQR